jgi:Fe-S cluster assembly iron-binding protein IscA
VVIDQFSQLYLDNTIMDYELSDTVQAFKFYGGSAEKSRCACGSSFSA